jgi:hypothetical protein
MFFCRDKDADGKRRLPFEGLFYNCEPTEMIGLGATVLDGQWDSDTGRNAVRWAEINAVLNFLRNGNGMDYLQRRLSAYAGASLDTVWPDRTPGAPGGGHTDLRLNFGIMGMLRSESNRLEIRGYAGYRPAVADLSDSAYEARAQLMYHLLLGRRAMGTVGLELGADRWETPWKSIGPFASDTERTAYYLRLMFRMIFQ